MSRFVSTIILAAGSNVEQNPIQRYSTVAHYAVLQGWSPRFKKHQPPMRCNFSESTFGLGLSNTDGASRAVGHQDAIDFGAGAGFVVAVGVDRTADFQTRLNLRHKGIDEALCKVVIKLHR